MKHSTQFQKDFNELLRYLPQPVHLKEKAIPEQPDSCIICISGFEPRCFAAANQLAGMNWHTNAAICVHYAQKEMLRVNDKHKKKLYKALTKLTRGDEPIPLTHDDHDFEVDFGDQLLKKLSDNGLDICSKDTHIVFDITVGSSRLLLEGLHALLTSGVSLTVLYSEATIYRPFFDEYQKYREETRDREVSAPEFLTSGVENIELIKRISGHNADQRPTYLIAFPSFNPIRIGAALEEMSPSRVYWLYSMPHLVNNRWRIDAQRDYHKRLIEHLHRHCYVSTFDYTETLDVLESIYCKTRDDYNMLVCSLSSKLQKLGQVLFHILRPEVGAVVSVPSVWDPDRYSDKKPRAIYSIPLGDCRKLREQLWLTRTLRL